MEAETVDDFVENQDCSVCIAQCAQTFQKSRRR